MEVTLSFNVPQVLLLGPILKLKIMGLTAWTGQGEQQVFLTSLQAATNGAVMIPKPNLDDQYFTLSQKVMVDVLVSNLVLLKILHGFSQT